MIDKKEYIKSLNDLENKMKQALYKTHRTVKKEPISPYWDSGKSIVGQQEKLGWGQKGIQ